MRKRINKYRLKNAAIVFMLLSGPAVLAQTVEIINKTSEPVKVFLKGHHTKGAPYQVAYVQAHGNLTLVADRAHLKLPSSEARYDLTVSKDLDTTIPVDLRFLAGECNNLS